jgi:hypothetical protein
MFRKAFFQIYRVLHSLWEHAQQLTGKPPQKPLDPRAARIQRRLARSKGRARRTKKR